MPLQGKDTYSVQGVEIFSCGKWNGDEYTIQDLEEMIRAFEDNKQGARPYIKLGHDSKQKLLQNDGLPSAGWIDRLYIINNKLIADFVDIPSKIYALIKSKAYRKVSSEIFWNITIGEKTYKRMLAAVALLGADTPGVMNLNDILSMYKIYKNSYEKINAYDGQEFKLLNEKGSKSMEKTENEIKLELELKAQKELAEKLDAEKKEFALKQVSAEKELADLKEYKKQSEIEQAKLAAQAEALRIDNFVKELQSEKLCTPAMKDLVTEILGVEKKEYTAQKLNKENAIKEMLKLFKAAKDVNFDENSSHDYKKNKDMEEEMDKMAKDYMKKNNVSYGQALKQVMKDKQK
jgi:hypothetical protein